MGKLKLFLFGLLFITISIFTSCTVDSNNSEKNHTFGDWVIITEPTCTSTGLHKRTCTGCGYVETENISATGHSYNSGIETTAATCTEKGVKTYTCSVCSLTRTEEIAALGHSYDSGIETTAATCTEKGVKTYTCSVCSSTRTEEIAALGHSFDGIKCTKCGSYSVEISEIATQYTDIDGLSLVLNTFTHTLSDGYNNYSINYTLTNSVTGSEISPGVFKIIYKKTDGTLDSSFQTGLFNKMYYGDTLTRSYSWKLTSEKSFVCIEYISSSQISNYIFSKIPSNNLLNWVIE